MSYDDYIQNAYSDKFKHCLVCGIDYEDDGNGCPSCNPRLTYRVEIGVANGDSDWEFAECQCPDCPANGYWRKSDAVDHAKMIKKRQGETYGDSCVRVVDSQGTEISEL